MELNPDDNEMYELDKHTARRYRFHGVGVDRPDATVVVACDQHTDPKSLPFRARALTTTTPPAAAVVANVWDALEFIERHEREVHQGFAAPARSAVPYLPLNPADATAVLPVVPAAVPFRGPSVHVVAVPNGAAGAVLPGLPLQLRHRSARPVVVRSLRLADGAHLVTLPADGFPGATWEIRVEAPAYARAGHFPATGPATDPLTCGHPVPDRWISTGCVICRAYLKLSGMEPPSVAPYRAEDHAADACSRCGGWVKTDPARMVLPPPLGSLSATHPATLCGSCAEGLVDLVAAYVASEPTPEPAAGGSWPVVPGGPVLRVDLDADKCPNCLASIVRCNASGCGQRQAPGWRVAQRLRDNGMEVRG